LSIEGVAFAVPSLRQSSADVARQTGAAEAFIADKVGVAQRYILADDESGVTLAVAACRRLIEQSEGLANVGLLVCVTQNPDRRIPHNAPLIAHALGLPHHVASFDISLGCSGYVYGLEIVEGFLARCGIEDAILVTCDPYSRVMASEDRSTNCVFGDAATATWIRASGTRSRTLAVDFGTDGGGASAISIPSGGAARPFVSLTGSSDVATYTREELRLHMDGRSVYNFVMDRVPVSIETCLQRAGCKIEDIGHFLLHQGSAFMIDALSRKAGIPTSRMFRNMSRYGNTVSSSIPLLLAELEETSQLRGSLVLMAGFGVGLSWATSVVEFN
jgi:3-oxoacyl-[acyl-carrier-protein] synthase III